MGPNLLVIKQDSNTLFLLAKARCDFAMLLNIMTQLEYKASNTLRQS